MKTPALLVALVLAAAACETTTGPSSQPNPAGTVIAWFDGLAGTVDLYYPGCDSLVSPAYTAGSAPNDILFLGDDMLAVLNSLTPSLQVFDLSSSGTLLHEVELPQGSNPWAMAYGYEGIWITLLASHQVVEVSTDDWTIAGSVDVPDNPSGIAIAAGRIYVSHADWPVSSSPGGVTVLNAVTLEQEGWIDTGVNTSDLWYCTGTGSLHAMSTTYTGDGTVTIIDPLSCSIQAQVLTVGPPASPVKLGTGWACCESFGDTVYFYGYTGTPTAAWVPVESASLGGMAVSGDTLYMTDFGGDTVIRAFWETQSLIDPLPAGDGPQGMEAVARE